MRTHTPRKDRINNDRREQLDKFHFLKEDRIKIDSFLAAYPPMKVFIEQYRIFLILKMKCVRKRDKISLKN